MSFTVSEIVDWIGGRVVNSGVLAESLAKIKVQRPTPLGASLGTDIAFFFSKAYQAELLLASPGILVTGEEFVQPIEAAGLPIWKKSAIVACSDPYYAMAVLSEKFARELSTVYHLVGSERDGRLGAKAQVHPLASVDPSAELGPGVRVGPGCIIEAKAKIGAGTLFYGNSYVGPGCEIGEGCVFFAGVTLYEWTCVGDRVRIHSGAVIGADGFGYASKREGKAVVGHQKIYHLGKVVIGDDVEIGANTCVDRATFGETRIGRGCKLDNLIQLGHNVHLEEGVIICGGACVAGSASIGRYAYIGGISGIDNQVHVGMGARVGAGAIVTKDVPPGGTAVGNPQREYREHFRAHAVLNRLMEEKKTRSPLGPKKAGEISHA